MPFFVGQYAARVPPRWLTRAAFVLGVALVVGALVAGELWSLPLALCALSILLVGDGVWLGWAGIVTALGAPLSFAAGFEGVYDGLILASLGLWALAFVISWPARGHARI